MKTKRVNFFNSIHFKIPLAFILVLIVTIEIIGGYFVRRLEQQNIQSFENSIQVQEYLTSQMARELDRSDQKSSKVINDLIQDINKNDISDIQVANSKGQIVGSLHSNDKSKIGSMAGQDTKRVIYTNRKETKIVYDNDNGSSYISITPLSKQSNDSTSVVGAIYIRANMDNVYKNINDIILIFLSASIVAGILGAIISIIISRAITRPIDEMKQQAMKMSEGDYSGQVRVYSEDELGQLAIAVNDLSVKVEEETENSEAERRRLDSVLTQMSDGVIATNRRGNITIINERAQEFLNIENSADVIGQPIVDVLGISDSRSFEDILENQDAMIIDVSENGGTSSSTNNSDNDLILNVDFSLIERDSGFVNGIVCVLHDVTEQQRVDRDRKEFVSNVSHELRTPLTSIRSYIETLNDGAWKDETIAPQFLKVAEEELERMSRMINDLLNLSRLDQGTFKLEKELVNFNEFLNFILDRFDMMLKKQIEHSQEDGEKVKNYKIKRVFTKKDLWVEIDTDRMTQVVDNILNNAIKYSPDGGTITVRLLETNKHVIVSVSDEGLGIPRKDQVKVFDRFYRVDKARSRKQGGTGLGLSISKEVVEAHNGKIWVNSSEGKGSTFYISLPYNPDESGGEWDEN